MIGVDYVDGVFTFIDSSMFPYQMKSVYDNSLRLRVRSVSNKKRVFGV